MSKFNIPWELIFIWFLGNNVFFSCHSQEVLERQVYYDNSQKVYLKQTRTIPIQIDNGPTLGIITRIWVSDNSIYFLDYTAQSVYEYDLAGKFVNEIKNKTITNQLKPSEIISDEQGNLYIYDAITGNIQKFDKEGNYVGNFKKERDKYTAKLLSDFHKNFFHLCEKQGISVLERIDIETGNAIFITQLSDKSLVKYVSFLGKLNGLSFSKKHNRVYHTFPWEYKIREIDANSGKIISRFGLRPQTYTEYNLSLSNIKEIINLKPYWTTVVDQFVIDERFLFIQFFKQETQKIDWYVYDLDTEKPVRGYSLGDNTLNNMNRRFVTKNNEIFVYSSPRSDQGDKSNGVVYAYSVLIE